MSKFVDGAISRQSACWLSFKLELSVEVKVLVNCGFMRNLNVSDNAFLTDIYKTRLHLVYEMN